MDLLRDVLVYLSLIKQFLDCVRLEIVRFQIQSQVFLQWIQNKLSWTLIFLQMVQSISNFVPHLGQNLASSLFLVEQLGHFINCPPFQPGIDIKILVGCLNVSENTKIMDYCQIS